MLRGTYTAAYMRHYREKRGATGAIVTCACGCGATFPERDRHNGRPRRFVRGHNKRVDRAGCFKKGQ